MSCPGCASLLPAGTPVCGVCGTAVEGSLLTAAAWGRAPVAVPTGVANALLILLAAGLVVAFVDLLLGVGYGGTLRTLMADPSSSVAAATRTESTRVTVAGVQGLTYLATVVLWVVWQYQTYGAVRDLGGQEMRYSQGWSVGAWFVPFLQLVRPPQMVGDLWRGSDPRRPAGLGLHSSAHSRLVPFWWAAFLASMLGGRVGAARPGRTLQDLASANQAMMVADALSVVAAVLALVLVRRLSQRVQLRARTART